ncbi:hypothetical protein ACPCXF_16420 [Lysinibacillus agricola]
MAYSKKAHLKLLDLSDVDRLFALTDCSRETLREWLPFVGHGRGLKVIRKLSGTIIKKAKENMKLKKMRMTL